MARYAPAGSEWALTAKLTFDIAYVHLEESIYRYEGGTHSHKIVPHGASWHAGKSVVVRAQSKDTDFDSILTTLADKVWYFLSQGCRFMACQPVDPHGCLTSMVSANIGSCTAMIGFHAVYAVREDRQEACCHRLDSCSCRRILPGRVAHPPTPARLREASPSSNVADCSTDSISYGRFCCPMYKVSISPPAGFRALTVLVLAPDMSEPPGTTALRRCICCAAARLPLAACGHPGTAVGLCQVCG